MTVNPPTPTTYTVTFKDYDGRVIKTEEVESGKSATAPAAPTREGYVFDGWDITYANITANVVITATYREITPSATHTVTFYDYDVMKVLGISNVENGKFAIPPTDPSKSGTKFLGWKGNYTNVTKDESVIAVYDDSKNVFVVESTSGSVGDTVTLLVSVDGNVKVCGFDLTLYYDNEILELVTHDADLDLDVVVNTQTLNNGIILNFSSATEKTKRREIISLTFRIKDTTADATSVNLEMTSIKEIIDDTSIVDSTCELVVGVVTIK